MNNFKPGRGGKIEEIRIELGVENDILLYGTSIFPKGKGLFGRAMQFWRGFRIKSIGTQTTDANLLAIPIAVIAGIRPSIRHKTVVADAGN